MPLTKTEFIEMIADAIPDDRQITAYIVGYILDNHDKSIHYNDPPMSQYMNLRYMVDSTLERKR